MSDFSLTDAALEGLRITRERPRMILWWWAAWIVATLVCPLILALPPFRSAPELIPEFVTAQGAAMAHPGDTGAYQRAVDLMSRVAPALFALYGFFILAQLLVSTAVLRAVLRPAERSLGALRLSLDELRQVGLAAMILVALFAYFIVVGVVISGILAALGAGPSSAISTLAAPVLMLWAVAYPAVRLSLAPAMTLADGRISFLRAWSLTKGLFAPLLGAYAIALAIAFALYFAVSQPVAMALELAGWHPTPTLVVDLKSLASPFVLVQLAVGALLHALLSAILVAPAASAFRQITGRVGAPAPQPEPNASTGSPWG